MRDYSIKKLPSGKFTVAENGKRIPGCPAWTRPIDAGKAILDFRRQEAEANARGEHWIN